MNLPIKTRFAPSPTGKLHIGGARTAIVSWLIAHKLNGKFTLRIEDTDTVRSKQEYTESIMDSLKWLEINYDERPVFQTQRYSRYREVADQLIKQNLAYYCYSTKEELNLQREKYKILTGNDGWKYGRKWREFSGTLPEGGSPTIRLKIPLDGSIAWNDLTKGEISISNNQLDDFIILRSDGSPTYNFCVVIDDSDMGISHVIRGDDHISNTPKQIHIYNALKKPIPVFGHIPLILNIDGSKQSKSAGSNSINYYRDLGVLPEAITNYLLLISCNDLGQEIFTKNQFVQLFELNKLGASPIKFDLEKLLWINNQYLKCLTKEKFVSLLYPQLVNKTTLDNFSNFEQMNWQYIMPGIMERSKTVNDFTDLVIPVLNWNKLGIQAPIIKEAMEFLLINEKVIKNFTPVVIHDELKNWTESQRLKFGELMKPLRNEMFPNMKLPVAEVLAFIGSEELKNTLLMVKKPSTKL